MQEGLARNRHHRLGNVRIDRPARQNDRRQIAERFALAAGRSSTFPQM